MCSFWLTAGQRLRISNTQYSILNIAEEKLIAHGRFTTVLCSFHAKITEPCITVRIGEIV